MNLELVLELAGVVISGGSLMFALLAWLSSRRAMKAAQRSLEASEEQLRLIREQANARPVLEVTEVCLLEPEEVKGVDELVREVEEERVREREWEERSKQIEHLPITKRLFEEDELNREYTALSMKHRYEGPVPNKVVRVTLANRGETTAFGVVGWLYFESSHLEPLGYFSHGAKVFDNRAGAYRVEVGNGGDILLAPGGQHYFDIAVSVHSPGITWVVYDLSSPTGSATQDVKALEIPDI